MLSEEHDRRHQYQPTEHAARQHDRGHPQPDDVADAEVLGRDIRTNRSAFENLLAVGIEVRRPVRRRRKEAEQIFILEERVEAAESEAQEHATGERTAAFSRLQDVSAGSSLGIGQRAVFFDDQLSPQRDHEQHAKPTAEQGERKDSRTLEIEAQEDQRRQREDHAGRDGLARIASRLHDIVFEDRSTSERAKDGDRQHGNWDARRDRQAGAQADIHRHRAKDHSKDRAQKQCAYRQFLSILVRWNKGAKGRMFSHQARSPSNAKGLLALPRSLLHSSSPAKSPVVLPEGCEGRGGRLLSPRSASCGHAWSRWLTARCQGSSLPGCAHGSPMAQWDPACV